MLGRKYKKSPQNNETYIKLDAECWAMSELYSLSWQQVQQVFESRGWVIVAGLIQACLVTLIDL